MVLRVVIPNRDTIRTPLGRQRIAASTLPTARAFLNGAEARVYPSGAFVGLVNLGVGSNTLRLTVVSPAGDSLWKEYVVLRSEPPKTFPRDSLGIDSIMMEPSESLWLGNGDILEVKFKGTPGLDASFDIEGVESGIPMKEVSPREGGGFEGVYVGRYQVREEDETKNAQVKFRLRQSFWSSERAYSKGRVTITSLELPRVAEVVGRRPFLNVGLGDDRLGGAKLGYLNPGVRVIVTGRGGQQYRVRLSESMVGWLPVDFAKLLPPETPLPKSLVGSLSVVGSDSEDIVLVSLLQRLPYTSDQQVGPPAIVVDLYGATSNTNWITQQLTAQGIESVSWDQVAAEHYRLTVLLKHKAHWGYDIGYDEGTALRIRVRRPPVVTTQDSVLKGMTIAVDAGHGGNNEGAYGATAAREMDITLAAAKHLEQRLIARGARVVMTRSDTTGPSMTDRFESVMAGGAKILVSIHCNSVGGNSDPERVKGTSTYYRYVGFKPLADIMYEKMLSLGLAQFGVIGSFNFSLNAPTQLPNVLVETAFLSNPEDEMLLIDDAFRTKIAEKIIEGLESFIKNYGVFKLVTPNPTTHRTQPR